MPLSDQLILETQQAFRALDSLQSKLDNLSDVRIDVTADTSGLNSELARTNSLVEDTAQSFGQVNDEITLTTDEYIQAVRAIEQGADAAQAVAVATGQIAMEAVTVDDAYRNVARALNLSDEEARDLAQNISRATTEASELDVDVRRIARSMGIAEDDVEKFVAQMKRAETATRETSTAAGGLTSSIGRLRGLIVGAVAAFGVRGLVNQFNEAITSANALGESINAVKVTFGEGADEVIRFAETAAESAGLATSQAQQLVVPIGALLRNFGFEAQSAGEAAVVLTQRAADLASVFNSEVPEALTAISAALRGESDPLERFGASINAARVEAFALSEGLAESKDEITDAIKVQARYGLILADTASAAGDFAATSDQAANATRILQAEAENARAELGGALLPAYEALLSVAPQLVDALEATAPALADAAEGFAQLLAEAGPLFDRLSQIQQAFGLLSDASTLAVSPIRQSAEALASLFTFDVGGFAANIGELGEVIEDSFDRGRIRGAFIAFQEALLDGENATTSFRDAIEGLAEADLLDERTFRQFARAAGLTDEQLFAVTRTLLEQSDVIDENSDAFDLLRRALTEAGTAARLITPEVQKLERFRLGSATEEVVGFSEAFATAELRAIAFEEGLEGIEQIAEQTGLSVAVVASNLALFDSDLAEVVAGIDAAEFANAAFVQSLEGLATAVNLDFGDAVDEFDLLISKTNEAGDEVPTTVEEMLEDLRTQAERFARLEAATTILDALGFDSLAADLREKGPEAVEAAEAFVDDLRAAAEAESIFDEGFDLGETGIDGLKEALSQGDITPELLDLASQFTSESNRQAVLDAALETGRIFGDKLQEVLNALGISIPVDVFTANVTGIGSAAQLPQATSSSGGVGGGGNVTVDQTIIFQDTPQPTAATNQIANATSTIIRAGAQ